MSKLLFLNKKAMPFAAILGELQIRVFRCLKKVTIQPLQQRGISVYKKNVQILQKGSGRFWDFI